MDGKSLQHAWIPQTQAQLDQWLAQLACPYCLETRIYDISEGELFRLKKLHYYQITKVCPCDFKQKVCVIANDLLGKKVSGKDALAGAKHLLPSVQSQEITEQLNLLLMEQRLHDALTSIKALVHEEPENLDLLYLLASLQMESGQFEDSLVIFQRLTEEIPEFAEAWYSQAVIHTKMGDETKANQAMEQCWRLEPSMMSGPEKQLAVVDGRFGKIEICQDEEIRSFKINRQIQSRCFMVLDEHGQKQPSCLPVSFYSIGWLFAGTQAPRGRGLMLGLGGGIGVACLLANFPNLRLDVIEIDPVNIKLSQEWFPMLKTFGERLRIIEADAFEYVAQCQEHYDFCLLDLYSGEREQVDGVMAGAFLKNIAKIATHCWINLIARKGYDYIEEVLAVSRDAGQPCAYLTTIVSPISQEKVNGNWLLTTQKLDLEIAKNFEPFSWLAPCREVSLVRHYYQKFVNHAIYLL